MILSGREALAPAIGGIYNRSILVDQLMDDMGDWKDDYEEGRVTLPVVASWEAAGVAYEVGLGMLTAFQRRLAG
ncbi:MAG TPA: hypothetical protein VLL52_03915 [Anaerolineae bacterium]|nr:hypothetical protein [Anaerolineae bacterium]